MSKIWQLFHERKCFQMKLAQTETLLPAIAENQETNDNITESHLHVQTQEREDEVTNSTEKDDSDDGTATHCENIQRNDDTILLEVHEDENVQGTKLTPGKNYPQNGNHLVLYVINL